jgi:hypothetical protein
MNYYKKIFEDTLTEFKIPNTDRNPDDVKISDEVDQDAFDVRAKDDYNTDPNDPNVGFAASNKQADIKELKSLLSEIDQMSKTVISLSERVSKLNRSFDGITDTTKEIAGINEKLGAFKSGLQSYIIQLPSQEQEEIEGEEY